MDAPLATLRAAGLWVESDGRGHLTAGPRAVLTDERRAYIATHRAAILDALESMRLEETTRNILALSPSEREAYRRELARASPGDPWLAHDAEALARADAIGREREAA